MSTNGRQPTERELLSAALVRAQAKMPAVEKTAKANYGMYATIDHLIAKTRKVLNDEGLAIIQFPAVSDLGAPVLRTVIVHEAGGREQADAPLFMAKQDMQTLGAAITYARRYAWASVCGIASEHDDDGQETARPEVTMDAPIAVQRITEPQRVRLRAIQKECGVSDDTLKKIVALVAGVQSSKDIPAVRYDALVAAVQQSGAAMEAAVEDAAQSSFKVPDGVPAP